MPKRLYATIATAALLITGCASSGLVQSSIKESALPMSRGYHVEPLRFERWSYLYSDAEAHHLAYRWHVGPQTYSKEVLVSPSGCSLVGVRPVTKEQ